MAYYVWLPSADDATTYNRAADVGLLLRGVGAGRGFPIPRE